MTLSSGDVVTRYISGGSFFMKMIVTSVTDELVICGDWTFNRVTGGEVDTLLGWDGVTRYGTYIKIGE